MRIAHDFASPCQLKALRPHIRAGSLRAAAEIPLVCNRRAPKPDMACLGSLAWQLPVSKLLPRV